jgi:hypothetical protein
MLLTMDDLFMEELGGNYFLIIILNKLKKNINFDPIVLTQNIVSPSAVLLRCLPCGHDLSPKVLNPLGWSIC